MSTAWPRQLWRGLTAAFLYLAAICGVAVAAWMVAAHVLNLHLVVVLTGSMEPTIPAGSVVMSQTVSASKLEVGDIITAPRPGYTLPVTHRIVDIAALSPNGGELRTLTLRGDANPINDPDPYTLDSADKTMAVVPHVGGLLTRWVTPVVGLALIVFISALVTWAFWPRRQII